MKTKSIVQLLAFAMLLTACGAENTGGSASLDDSISDGESEQFELDDIVCNRSTSWAVAEHGTWEQVQAYAEACGWEIKHNEL